MRRRRRLGGRGGRLGPRDRRRRLICLHGWAWSQRASCRLPLERWEWVMWVAGVGCVLGGFRQAQTQLEGFSRDHTNMRAAHLCVGHYKHSRDFWRLPQKPRQSHRSDQTLRPTDKGQLLHSGLAACAEQSTGSPLTAATAGIFHCPTVLFYGSIDASLRLELERPCKPGRHLLNCPDFSAEQPYGPADMPHRDECFAPEGECPRCDYESYDMRKRRMCKVAGVGLRLGIFPSSHSRKPGFDVRCVVM